MEQATILRPTDVDDLTALVSQCAADGHHLEARAGGSKRHIGCPGRKRLVADLSSFTGIVDYEPSELVLTVRPATPLVEVEALLAQQGQMLAFEPWDHGAIHGSSGAATIGGVIAAGVAGPRRVSAGGARDHLLGFSAISGRGELFKAGGKVVKNVTGYDVSKLIAGSWGQLAIMTELSLKILPSPRHAVSAVLEGLTPCAAIAAMAKALGSPATPAAVAHIPATPNRTVFRLEGFYESVMQRLVGLKEALAPFGRLWLLDEIEAAGFWSTVRLSSSLADCETLWRIHVPPSRAASLAGELERSDAKWLFDWGGALVCAGAPANADIRGIAARCSGHAMLLQAPIKTRERVPARLTVSEAVTALTARIKRGFDPRQILDPLRFS